MVEDEVVVGVVSAPALGRRWWASKGGGAWTGKSLLRATPRAGSPTSTGSRTRRCPTPRWAAGTSRPPRRLPRAGQALLAHPRYGDFWSYMLVAEGAVDVAAEPELRAATTWPRSTSSSARRVAGSPRLDGQPRPERRQRARHQRPPARPGRSGVSPASTQAGRRRPRAAPRRLGLGVHDLSSRRRRTAAGAGLRRRRARDPARRRSSAGATQQRGEVEPAVAAGRARSAGCRSTPARSGRAAARSRCRGGCRPARARSRPRRHRRRPARDGPQRRNPPGRGTRRRRARPAGRAASSTPYAAQAPTRPRPRRATARRWWRARTASGPSARPTR